MAQRNPEGVPEEESFPIPGTPDEPTLKPSEQYMPYSPPPGHAPMRSDADIAHDIENALFRDDLVRSYQVQVSVQHGDVTLSGTTDDVMESIEAEKVACRVPGVKHVNNQIQVRQ